MQNNIPILYISLNFDIGSTVKEKNIYPLYYEQSILLIGKEVEFETFWWMNAL